MDATKPTGRVAHAFFRLGLIAQKFEDDGFKPGLDVSMFRALRELHSVLGTEAGEKFDPNRLVRGLLFNGLAEAYSWTEVGK